MVSCVAVPWQRYPLTPSNAQIGLPGLVQRVGPIIGNARAGFIADAWGVPAAIGIGGAVCLAGVIGTGFALRRC